MLQNAAMTRETNADALDAHGPLPSLGHVRARLRVRHLVVIEALARRKNIRQAASDLFVTQPAASKLLQEIESIFEARLFERTAHGIEITPYGEVLLHWARKGLADMDAAHAEIAALRNGWEGRVRVGVFPVAGTVLVPDAATLLRKLRPGIQLSLQEGLETSLLPLLDQGQLDCVIGRATSSPGSRPFTCEMLFEEPTVIVCAVGHPLLQDTDWTPAQLDRFDWILPARTGQLYTLVASGLAALKAAAPRVAVETSSILTLVEIVRQTQMLSAIPSGVARRFVDIGQLQILPLTLSATLHPVSIMTSQGSPLHPATAAFLSAVKTVAATRG
ncbi:Galactose-binding protein regulator [Variovorax sp. PBL-E5]|nr:Galactose-binding protein regulator [Variovorax sp. PBL-E5]